MLPLSIIEKIDNEEDLIFYESLYKSTVDRLVKSTRRILRGIDEQDALDIVHTLFLDLIQDIDKLKAATSPESYIFVCLRHQISKYLKDRKECTSFEDFLEKYRDPLFPAEMTSVEDIVIGSERAAFLQSFIQELPLLQQEYVRLKYFMGLDNAEIGKLLDISREYAKVLDYRARQTLKKLMKSYRMEVCCGGR